MMRDAYDDAYDMVERGRVQLSFVPDVEAVLLLDPDVDRTALDSVPAVAAGVERLVGLDGGGLGSAGVDSGDDVLLQRCASGLHGSTRLHAALPFETGSTDEGHLALGLGLAAFDRPLSSSALHLRWGGMTHITDRDGGAGD